MLRNHLAWRKKVGADTILEDCVLPEVITTYYAGGWCGFDKEGDPVWVDPVGRLDLKGIAHSAKKEDIIKSKIMCVERGYRMMADQSKKLGKRVSQLCIIFDMEGFGMKHLWKPGVDIFCEILEMFESNYPETLKRCYVINAPKIFPLAYHIVKPILSEDTKNKIKVLGSNWKERVLRDIDPKEIPLYWGGTRTDPDGNPFCKSKVCIGGEVPKSYYLREKDQLSSEYLVKSVIKKGSMLPVELEVNEPGCAIRWEFHTENHDIGYAIYYKTSPGEQNVSDMEVVVGNKRVNSHLVPEDGTVYCSKAGIYVFCFDNSYSWTRSKTVLYVIEVIHPETPSAMCNGYTQEDGNE
ncbi:SEC14-like protein 2 [Lingula anatina]|uniref:SEC14-like protein 2 n=1 Tax=Lingula anatina TaxID=7574 RepID=A0A1S3IWZ5_LINAN|nr:SEC14-like protein 2 [Lingula anatina]|eukprot:XP_013402720.2 SEC14-like protein 2 [Lingula anatina]